MCGGPGQDVTGRQPRLSRLGLRGPGHCTAQSTELEAGGSARQILRSAHRLGVGQKESERSPGKLLEARCVPTCATDWWGLSILGRGATLYVAGCLAATLASVRHVPLALPSLRCDNQKGVQMLPISSSFKAAALKAGFPEMALS